MTGDELLTMGLVERLVEPGAALDAAVGLAHELAGLPQACLRGDRASVHEQWGLELDAAARNELRHGRATLASGETLAGARRFTAGEGRHGSMIGAAGAARPSGRPPPP